VPFLAARGVTVAAEDARLIAAMPLVKPRSNTLPDIAERTEYFFQPVKMDEAAKKLLTPEATARMQTLATLIENITPSSTRHRVRSQSLGRSRIHPPQRHRPTRPRRPHRQEESQGCSSDGRVGQGRDVEAAAG